VEKKGCAVSQAPHVIERRMGPDCQLKKERRGKAGLFGPVGELGRARGRRGKDGWASTTGPGRSQGCVLLSFF